MWGGRDSLNADARQFRLVVAFGYRVQNQLRRLAGEIADTEVRQLRNLTRRRSEGVRSSFPNGPQGLQNYNGLNTPAGASTISQADRALPFSWAVVAKPAMAHPKLDVAGSSGRAAARRLPCTLV